MNTFSKIFDSSINKFNIFLSEEQIEKFNTYCQMLLKWNEKINLTAITDPNQIAVKHFADSISIFAFAQINEGASVIDVGTGAGFPGIPLAIVRPDIKLTLLDSLNKRLVFLKEVTNTLGISCDIIHMRAEDGGKAEHLREKFDIAVSRAVANLNVLSEYCIPFVKVGGQFIAMKGPNIEEEIRNSKNSITVLGGKIKKIESFNIGDNSRNLLIIDKIKKTPSVYPRHGSKISKKPL